ncbi:MULTISPECIES: flagellar motor protein MotB [Campylobacter]|uniref:OmpA/MotB family protein n=1 Tax=Campylobacter TaxID=194 RepID=UPI00027A3765|nr:MULTISPECIES: flagellar motor protein MotB [Campylobacter]EJP76287.1 OmpA family protein [Campylobacter sp. FOBRC14]MBN7289058.1 flagellar motor protein MotB [Campylobacter curvus]MDU6827715.1 flagellar motor protein MotB [Campylobacter sp.]
MPKLINPNDCPKCMPEWLATFGDLMSLLLCFFVLLLSMATMDAKKVEAAVGSLAGALSVLEGGARPDNQDDQESELEKQIKKTKGQSTSSQGEFSELSATIKKINELLSASGAPEISIDESEDGFIIRLPSALLFEPGKAQIENDDARLFLKRIAMVIAKLTPDVNIDIVGHTDDQRPDMNSIFKDNWQLSTARAISVVEEMAANGVDARKLIASGRASYDPFASNQTPEGRAKNNRVEIHFVSLDRKNKEATKKSILDVGK